MHFRARPKKSYRKTWVVGPIVPMACWTCHDIIWLERMIVDKAVFIDKVERCQACWAAAILEHKERDASRVSQQGQPIGTIFPGQSQAWPFPFPQIGGTIVKPTTTPTSNP